MSLAVNHLGHFLLVNLLLPALQSVKVGGLPPPSHAPPHPHPHSHAPPHPHPHPNTHSRPQHALPTPTPTPNPNPNPPNPPPGWRALRHRRLRDGQFEHLRGSDGEAGGGCWPARNARPWLSHGEWGKVQWRKGLQGLKGPQHDDSTRTAPTVPRVHG